MGRLVSAQHSGWPQHSAARNNQQRAERTTFRCARSKLMPRISESSCQDLSPAEEGLLQNRTIINTHQLQNSSLGVIRFAAGTRKRFCSGNRPHHSSSRKMLQRKHGGGCVFSHTQNGLLTHMHTLLFLLQLLRILSLSRRSQKSQPLHQESALVQGD